MRDDRGIDLSCENSCVTSQLATLGITGAPFDSFLTLRGVRTLHARMRVHCENAARVVELLCAHRAVHRVYYPGLSSHPGHAVAASQQDGFGAMVSFEINGGIDGVKRFVNALQHFTLAESLGGVESLVAHPATMTHASMDEAARATAGISGSLLRLSVGIEHADDLVSDLAAALDAAAPISENYGDHRDDEEFSNPVHTQVTA